MEISENDDDTHDITFTDEREYTINLKGNKSPKTLKGIPSNKKPSFKDKKPKKEGVDVRSVIKEHLRSYL